MQNPSVARSPTLVTVCHEKVTATPESARWQYGRLTVRIVPADGKYKN